VLGNCTQTGILGIGGLTENPAPFPLFNDKGGTLASVTAPTSSTRVARALAAGDGHLNQGMFLMQKGFAPSVLADSPIPRSHYFLTPSSAKNCTAIARALVVPCARLTRHGRSGEYTPTLPGTGGKRIIPSVDFG